MKTVIFVLILLLSISCSSDEKKEDSNAGKLNEVCKSDQTCNDTLACVKDKCISKEEACKFITCSGEDGFSHGTCDVVSSKATCSCDENYENKNNTKCELSSSQEICKTDSCSSSDGYVCVIENNAAKCICPKNYKETAGKDMCILDQEAFCQPNPCDKNKNMTGYCSAEMIDGEVKESCECERGWFGENCDEEDPGCDKSKCLNDENSTGECYLDPSDPDKETICVCKEGYALEEVSGEWKCLINDGE